VDTLLLDQVSWDIVTDLSGNIAAASDPYSQAQDAASAARTFEGEVYYDTTYGMPYWAQILGLAPPLPLLKKLYNNIALTVPGLISAATFISGVTNRKLTGQIQVTNSSNELSASNF
jgi:hypothetical protein